MVIRYPVTVPPLTGEKQRKAYIYLPDDYGDDPQRRFPVMYMFDGHNVFFDGDATYGKSWGMYEYLHRTKRSLIIVAVECNHEGNGRLREYSPVSFANASLGKIPGKGKIYMDWLVNTLKPQIDAKYRTLPDRRHTSLCGSSMGGLMALYGATTYNRVFQSAACLSPSLWVAPGKVIELIAKARIAEDTCIYMDYGSQELSNHSGNMDALMSVAHLLMTKRVHLTFRIVPNGTHSEASWEKQIPVFMDCLGL